MSSLDRLINLAQRTGDRLIVHNPVEEQDVVIMGVDEYEKLIEKNDLNNCDYRVRNLTSAQLIDQINRDIANWRVNKEMDEEWGKEITLDEEYKNMPPFDPFAEVDFHPADWHSAGDVLENKYDFNNQDKNEEEKKVEDIPDFDNLAEDDDIIKKVPFVNHGEEKWQEESLLDEDEPVFYEEPV